jgi:hypothetical protein
MTMHVEPVCLPARVPLTPRSLLARISRRLATLSRLLAHDHGDLAYWSALDTTAAEVQRERRLLRPLATLLCIERANARGRIHGGRFPSLAAQAAWLAKIAHIACARSARAAGLPTDATLAMLRAGALEDRA